ncbi:MAG: DUF2357 domain-containing protein [Janthinobacterium lividum]
MSEPEQNEANQQDWRRLLTASERASMLGDIARVSLAAGARLFPDEPWSDLDVTAAPSAASKSPIERLSFAEYLLPVLTQALKRIMQSPLTSAIAHTRSAVPERARRVSTSAWMAYARQTPADRTVEERVTFLSYDTLENRAIKSFVQLLERDCEAIVRIAESEEETEAAGRASGCARRLHQLLAETWWEEVTSKSGDWTQPQSQREALRPDYARISQERVRYRNSFCFNWDQPLLTLPSRETWRIYEVWCLLTVFQALRDLGWDLTHAQELFAIKEGRLTATLAAGTRSRMVLRSAWGQKLTLTYNQTFAEGRESLSHTMQPDITLSDGQRVWILDAKFKPYAEPGEEGSDINQMHAYRDAIVGSDGVRNVAAARCLYAGLAQTSNRAHITYGRTASTAVGALCLRPGSPETIKNLSRLLESWVAARS